MLLESSAPSSVMVTCHRHGGHGDGDDKNFLAGKQGVGTSSSVRQSVCRAQEMAGRYFYRYPPFAILCTFAMYRGPNMIREICRN